MAKPRIYIPGVSMHVIRRGINRAAIVRDDLDYRVLLDVVEHAATERGVSVHGYVVMTNHYHLLVTPLDARALPAMMKTIGLRYTRYFNRKYDRTGTLWNGRYTDIHVLSEIYWLTCLRYIELNPVRANMVSAPDQYRWSSYAIHTAGDHSEWLVMHDAYLALGETPEWRQAAYRAICGVPLTDHELAGQRYPPPIRVPKKQSDQSEASLIRV
jgi:putative transposase